MESPEKKNEFKCRLCGHTEYKRITESNGIMGPGGRSWTLYIFCKNCFAMFKDLEKSSPQDRI